MAFPGLGAYDRSTFAILGRGDALAQELAPLGIRVTTVQPAIAVGSRTRHRRP